MNNCKFSYYLQEKDVKNIFTFIKSKQLVSKDFSNIISLFKKYLQDN